MSDTITPIRVFISSPGDLFPEREVVRSVLDVLNRSVTFRDRYKLIGYSWEQEVPALMGRAAQHVVDTYLLDPAAADIMVCMFWQRMGSPLDEVDPHSKTPYQSGTEYEFLRAYHSFQRHGKPLLLLYRCLRQPEDPNSVEQNQVERVRRFFERFAPDGDLQGLVGSFLNPTELQQIVLRDISLLLERDFASPRKSAIPASETVAFDAAQSRLRGYELQELVGTGGFGAVYRALQPALRREVAIKIIRPHYANQPEFIRRFETEAQLVARLEHPHIVPLYHYWREPGGAYLVMRYIKGGSLAGKIRGGPWPLDTALRLVEQLASALMYTHHHQIVHRDLKPANVLLDEQGHGYLSDFGIAKDLGAVRALHDVPSQPSHDAPIYLAPEQLRDIPATPQTDIYSLGVMLYELLAGVQPLADRQPSDTRWPQLPPIQHYRPDLPGHVQAAIQRATAIEPSARYPDIAGMLGDLIPSSRLLDLRGSLRVPTHGTLSATWPVLPSGAGQTPTADNPYKGLRAFSEADAADFFGREALTRRLLTRMAEDHASSRFLAVVGPSGSGKSSVVRAGLLPALRAGALPQSERWYVTTMRPGAHPWEELEASLLRVAVNPPSTLLTQLQENERGLARAIKRSLPDDESTELVLVIDQFEELFTLLEDEATRAQFIRSVLAAVQGLRSRLRVVITLRADFYDRPLLYPDLGEFMRQRTEVVLPLNHAELHDAITRPAARLGVGSEPELVAAIERDFGSQPGMLPLLQYALTELFERRAEARLTLDAYTASGGVQGMLTRRADELFERLNDAEQRIAQYVFLRLVTLGEGSEDTRRRATRNELLRLPGAAEWLDNVLNLFGRYRLLTFDHHPVTREPTVEVAHEALIRSWMRLKNWLDRSRETMLLQRRLAAAAAEWATNHNESSFLVGGQRLDQFAAGAWGLDVALTADEQAFLDASLAARAERQVAEAERASREAGLELRSRQSEQRARNLALTAGAQAALNDGDSSLALALALIANESDARVPQSEVVLSDAAYARSTRRVFRAHRGEVQTVAASPDGAWFLSGGEDLRILQCDCATGAVLRTFTGHTAKIQSLAIHADGSHALSGAEDHTAVLWDVASGTTQHTLRGHTATVNDVMFSPDGATVLTASSDKTVRLWSVATGEQIRVFAGHDSGVNAATFSPDGATVLTASSDKTVRLWRVADGYVLRILTGHTGDVWHVAPGPNGKTAVSASADRSIIHWDLETGTPLQRLNGHGSDVWRVAYNTAGTALLSASRDTRLGVWSVASGEPLFFLQGHGASVRSVAFLPNNRQALSVSIDGTVRLWDLVTGGEIERFTEHTASVNRLRISADGSRILTASSDQMLLLWDAASKRVVHRMSGSQAGLFSAALSPDGSTALCGCGDGTISFWNLRTGELMRRWAGHASGASTIEYVINGSTALSGSIDGKLRLWNLATGEMLREYVGHANSVYDLAVASDGTTALSASGDKSVLRWNLATGQVLRRFEEHTALVRSVVLSPDGQHALSAADDKLLMLWNIDTGAVVRRFVGHTAGVRHAAFNADGTLVVSGSSDNNVILWEVATGQALRRFVGHTQQVRAVAFAADGQTILSGSSDGTVRRWRIDTLPQLLAWAYANRDVPALTSEQRRYYGLAEDA